MDVVSYFRHMERVCLGSGFVPQEYPKKQTKTDLAPFRSRSRIAVTCLHCHTTTASTKTLPGCPYCGRDY